MKQTDTAGKRKRIKGQDKKVQNNSLPQSPYAALEKSFAASMLQIPYIKWRQCHFITSSRSHKDKPKIVKCLHATGLKVIQKPSIGKSKKRF